MVKVFGHIVGNKCLTCKAREAKKKETEKREKRK